MAASSKTSRTDPAVDAFLRDLDHPRKSDIEAVRRIILGVRSSIHEGIKWNSPNFRTTEYFATVNLRGKGDDKRVWLILHFGAKAKKAKKPEIADPAGLLKWLGKDRALVTFADAADIRKKCPALKAVLREWIKHI